MHEIEWRKTLIKQEMGVLVASDERLEWLLPWWWKNYSQENDYKITFVDLGLSNSMKQWCEERGERVELSFTMDESLFFSGNKEWEKCYGSSYESARKGWFKKPLALLQTPYEKTLWLDLDCEVLSSLNDVFAYCNGMTPLALAQDSKEEGENPIYNGGVVVYLREDPLVTKWAKTALTASHLYWGDDRILSSLIQQMQYAIATLPLVYNWKISYGIHLDAKILHWVGEWGKTHIQKFGGFRKLKSQSLLS